MTDVKTIHHDIYHTSKIITYSIVLIHMTRPPNLTKITFLPAYVHVQTDVKDSIPDYCENSHCVHNLPSSSAGPAEAFSSAEGTDSNSYFGLIGCIFGVSCCFNARSVC